MGLFAQSVSQKAVKVGRSTFDWSTFKGGTLSFVDMKVTTGKTTYKVEGQLNGAGSPWLNLFVPILPPEGYKGLTLAHLQAGYTFDKADMSALKIEEYPGRNDSGIKVKIKGRNISLTGFPTIESAQSVKSIKVKARA